MKGRQFASCECFSHIRQPTLVDLVTGNISRHSGIIFPTIKEPGIIHNFSECLFQQGLHRATCAADFNIYTLKTITHMSSIRWAQFVSRPVPCATASVDTTCWTAKTMSSSFGGHQLLDGLYPTKQPQWTPFVGRTVPCSAVPKVSAVHIHISVQIHSDILKSLHAHTNPFALK